MQANRGGSKNHLVAAIPTMALAVGLLSFSGACADDGTNPTPKVESTGSDPSKDKKKENNSKNKKEKEESPESFEACVTDLLKGKLLFPAIACGNAALVAEPTLASLLEQSRARIEEEFNACQTRAEEGEASYLDCVVQALGEEAPEGEGDRATLRHDLQALVQEARGSIDAFLEVCPLETVVSTTLEECGCLPAQGLQDEGSSTNMPSYCAHIQSQAGTCEEAIQGYLATEGGACLQEAAALRTIADILLSSEQASIDNVLAEALEKIPGADACPESNNDASEGNNSESLLCDFVDLAKEELRDTVNNLLADTLDSLLSIDEEIDACGEEALTSLQNACLF